MTYWLYNNVVRVILIANSNVVHLSVCILLSAQSKLTLIDNRKYLLIIDMFCMIVFLVPIEITEKYDGL